mgnify:FL=1
MNSITRLIAVLVVTGWAGCANAAPITFGFTFDRIFNGIPLELPFIGTGQVSFDDVGNGTFALTALSNLSMQFAVLGETFTLADAATPLGQVLAVVSDYGPGRRFQFSNSNGFGTGPFFGSIDLTKANGAYLTFQPPGFGPGLDLHQIVTPGRADLGSYLATSGVPVPGTLAILALGLALLALVRGGRFSRNARVA